MSNIQSQIRQLNKNMTKTFASQEARGETLLQKVTQDDITQSEETE